MTAARQAPVSLGPLSLCLLPFRHLPTSGRRRERRAHPKRLPDKSKPCSVCGRRCTAYLMCTSFGGVLSTYSSVESKRGALHSEGVSQLIYG